VHITQVERKKVRGLHLICVRNVGCDGSLLSGSMRNEICFRDCVCVCVRERERVSVVAVLNLNLHGSHLDAALKNTALSLLTVSDSVMCLNYIVNVLMFIVTFLC
jgi:hypothetical protein